MTTKAIIIEAGQHTRSLDTRSSHPKALDVEKHSNKPVLEWIVSSLRQHHIHDITYIGNYHIEKVIQKFPKINYIYYTPQDAKNEIEALKLFENSQNDNIFVIRSDMIILPSAFNLDTENKICLFYTSPIVTHENLAMLYVPSDQYQQFSQITNNNKMSSLHEINNIPQDSILISHKILEKNAASISNRLLLSQVVFQGKGKTLENMAPLLQKSIVLEQIRFSYQAWSENPNKIIENIQKKYPCTNVVVRSNTSTEDNIESSHAGAFLSILDVFTKDSDTVQYAIEQVIESYSKNDRICLPQDEILVQAQVENIKASGVILTREPRTGSPYFVLSLDTKSGRSDLVTAGSTEHIENYYIAWKSQNSFCNPYVEQITEVAKELLTIAPIDSLDIEFCIDAENKIYLLQVRPLIIKNKPTFQDSEILDNLVEIKNLLHAKFEKNPYLSGHHTVFGIMPDWNPAEMIGLTPKPLAFSLYQKLIGNQAWALARSVLGYKEIDEPLIHSFDGAPYIDVRASINSLLPRDLTAHIETAWNDWCIEQLRENPFLHDKVEFDIYITCLSPNWSKYEARLNKALTDKKDVLHFHNEVHRLTNHIFKNYQSILETQSLKLQALSNNIEKYISSSTHTHCGNIRKLINHIISDGIVPFAILARLAFISMSYLKDFVELKVFDETTKNNFLNAIPTIASKLTNDLRLFQKKKISLESLLSDYGHLRPNSYEITSDNYAANPNLYLQSHTNGMHESISSSNIDGKNILEPYLSTIDVLLSDLRLEINASQLIHFITSTITMREYAKFEFMKGVNKILTLIEAWGSTIGLNKEQLSYLHIDDILRFETDSLPTANVNHLNKTISFHKKKHSMLCSYLLPELITKPEDVFLFKLGAWKPNFVTLNTVIADVVYLKDSDSISELKNKIVCIEAADPGYDWIFNHNIAGLVTAFGGVASHMAIRAAEFNLPAAIGCGIEKFNEVKNAKKLHLNCADQILKVIK
ncbi:hypothetical protein CC99x_002055 [Candidatus Berkiella cookevillensis]|uniref:PEP-utilising enzyme mobile domain-containing protein n=1 Tax=Candidatus Berkiella cookevillensis TaxID=437022 RepID=A0A0Q9YGI3_9GAMM|nr:PEP-utilizing enzyme [Candidatus Berkiella cookevillensis]MCS5707682.1 hypothetical protein [Candidatus Berkiella cookevillensis]